MRLGQLSVAFVLVSAAVVGTAVVKLRQYDESARLVTGKFITPTGDQVEVGSFPVNMKLSPDGHFVVVTDCGFREQLTVLDANTGKLLSKLAFPSTRQKASGLYYGLDFSYGPERQMLLHVSRGAEDQITSYSISDSGQLSLLKEWPTKAPKGVPEHFAGLVAHGDVFYTVFNQTHSGNGMHGSVGKIGQSGVTLEKYPVGGYPMDIVLAKTVGSQGSLFVSNERDGTVSAIDLATKAVTTIKTGANTVALTLNQAEDKLFVSNSGSDTVSMVDPKSGKVIQTIYLRLGDLGGVPGATPLGMCLSPDESSLYVAMADINSVAVIDVASGKVRGFIPVGWGPTSVVVNASGKKLFVANSKGVVTATPNNKSVRDWGQYQPNILEGTVSTIDLPRALRDLESSTRLVLNNNLAVGGTERKNRKDFVNPGVDHVVYIIKENRTYDQILGDNKRGNGDPKICLFPKEVTPNQHALADRFVLLDNFYVCAEVSFDGWAWSTQGIANPYVERNVVYNYSGRGRSYDSEGENSGVPIDLLGINDVARSQNGYIWDQCAKQGISFRNYGFFLTGDSAIKDPKTGKPITTNNHPSKKNLLKTTNVDFLQFDTAFADSEAWVKHHVVLAPDQTASYGSHKDPSRVTTWLRDFNGYVKNGNMPKFSMLRLMRDHTAGTSPGQSSPRAMVADNDYAVGQVVDAISHGPYWKRTVICVLEDDAQAGFDHVDCHRSPAFVISPWIEKGKLDSHFYNTDSMLRTMELVLGLKPLNQYDTIATPLNLFTKGALNSEPYSAILPAKVIISEINTRTAYRAKDSARLISRTREDSLPDIELNDILWGAIKGANTPRPALRGAQWQAFDKD